METEKTDFRLITATNRDFPDLVREGKFRGDLYFRINRVSIRIPSLRDRSDDILLFIRYFSKTIAAQNGQPEKTITPSALDVCCPTRGPVTSARWPTFWSRRSGTVSQIRSRRKIFPDISIPGVEVGGSIPSISVNGSLFSCHGSKRRRSSRLWRRRVETEAASLSALGSTGRCSTRR